MKFSVWLKVLLVLALIAAGLVAGNYFAGLLFVIANKTNPLDIYATFWEWYGEYKNDPSQKKHLVFAGLVGFVATFAIPAIVYERATRKAKSLHGDARWANPSEVKASGLLGDTGIIVGRYRNRYLMLGGQLFALLAAPTRGGKGVGVVIPNLLNFPDSVVVLDVKGENYEITSGFRAKYGHECHLFNPFASDGRTAGWNPLSYINPNPALQVTDIMTIGRVFYPPDGKDAFFNDQALNLFLGIALYLVETPELPRTIGEALRQSSGKGKPIKDYLTDLIADRETTDRPLSDTCVQALQRFTSNSDNTLASILASFNAPLTIWANPIVDAATSRDDFNLNDVRRKRMSIYLAVPAGKISQASVVMNLFFSQLINLNTEVLPDKDPSLRYQCLLLMDEFTALGKVEVINSAVSYMAGYGLRLLPIIQSQSQLVSKYGEHDAQTLTTNHALRILYPPRENKDANEYSETLGTFTLKNASTSINNQSLMPFGGAPSRGESMSDQRRALMMPQELKEMGQDKEIVIFENTKPIFAEKIRYYADPVFVGRLKEVSQSLAALDRKVWGIFPSRPIPTQKQLKAAILAGELAAPVPLIDYQLHIARVQTRKRLMTEDDLPEEDGVLDLSALAHDFSDLQPVDDPERPAPEQVEGLVEDFFSRLEPPEDSESGGESHEYVVVGDEDTLGLSALTSVSEDGEILRVSPTDEAPKPRSSAKKKGGGKAPEAKARASSGEPKPEFDLSVLDDGLSP